MKLAIVGSREYVNIDRIRKIVNKYIEKYKDLVIISGGCPKGADYLGKQIALELNIPYHEYAPRHAQYNQYCVMPKDHYNKPFNVGNYFERNTEVAKNCDHLIAFVIKDVKCNGTMDTVGKARKFDKQVLIFED